MSVGQYVSGHQRELLNLTECVERERERQVREYTLYTCVPYSAKGALSRQRRHATSNSANIDSIVLNVTKNRDSCDACRTAHTVEVLTFTHLV